MTTATSQTWIALRKIRTALGYRRSDIVSMRIVNHSELSDFMKGYVSALNDELVWIDEQIEDIETTLKGIEKLKNKEIEA